VPENVSISHRGANYAIGQGPLFYGIWAAAAPHAQPLEWWHKTPEGWVAAWNRFTSVEVPGTITAVGPPAPAPAPAPGPAAPPAAATGAHAGHKAVIGAALLGLGVVLGVIGLFPDYVGGASLAQQAPEVLVHAIYLAVWTASAILILTGGVRRRVGALLAAGLSIVTLGLFLADAGTPIALGAHVAGAGLVLSLLGWLACAAGSAVALSIGPSDRLSRPAGHDAVPLIMVMVAALGAAIAFAPAWDSFALHTTLTGVSQTITEGNAFANPAAVIVGNVAVMVALVAVVVAAALWRPVRLGAVLLAGAIIPMAAQAISAIVQIREPASPAQFGLSPAQAAQVGLTIHAGLTAIFWVFCAFVAILILLCGWMIIAPEPAGQAAAPWLPGGTPQGWQADAPAPAAGYVQPSPGAEVPAAEASAAPQP
jgi:hypothetical protein